VLLVVVRHPVVLAVIVADDSEVLVDVDPDSVVLVEVDVALGVDVVELDVEWLDVVLVLPVDKV